MLWVHAARLHFGCSPIEVEIPMTSADYLMLLSFLPAIVFVLDIASLFLSRRNNVDSEPTPKLQIWLQDLLLFPPLFVLAMLWGFDRRDLETIVIPVVSLAAGFIAALDLCSAYKIRTGSKRVLVFVTSMAVFVVYLWLGFILWYLERFVRARTIRPRIVDTTSRGIAAAVTANYLLAFALPMGRGSPYGGLGIVRFPQFGSIHGELYGLGAYFVSFQSYFARIGAEESHQAPDFHFALGDGRLAWAANPCFWVAMCFFLERRFSMAAFLGTGACALAVSAWGTTMFTPINSLAYAIWFLSMVSLQLAALIMSLRRQSSGVN